MTNTKPDMLPDVLQWIADEIDLKTALTLAREFGGQRLYLPRTLHTDHPLCVALGPPTARTLVRLLGHGELVVPMAKRRVMEAERKKHIARLLNEGVPHSEIARRLHLHIRTVERWSARLQPRMVS